MSKSDDEVTAVFAIEALCRVSALEFVVDNVLANLLAGSDLDTNGLLLALAVKAATGHDTSAERLEPDHASVVSERIVELVELRTTRIAEILAQRQAY